MDMLDMVKKSLDDNRFLTDEIKNNIFELIIVFNNKFQDVDLTNVAKRLENLQVKKISKFLTSSISSYDNKNNVLYINTNEIDKYDMKHVLMFELLNMITSTETTTGFNIDNKFEALNIGYTEILANYLVGNDSDMMLYPEEAIETNLISVLVGAENMKKAYFSNNPEILVSCLNQMEGFIQ